LKSMNCTVHAEFQDTPQQKPRSAQRLMVLYNAHMVKRICTTIHMHERGSLPAQKSDTLHQQAMLQNAAG